MLTIRKIKVASGDGAAARRTAEYALDRMDSPEAVARAAGGDGEPREAQPTARWLGSAELLERLGLEAGATVAAGQLALAVQGRSPATGERIRTEGMIQQDARDERGRPRYDADGRRMKVRLPGTKSVDLTFSAPKSVSVLWSQARPALRARIEGAMLASAEAMLANMTLAKPVVAHRRALWPARGYAAAAALHVRARAADGEAVPAPQLHVHGIVVGVERDDGFFASPELSGMFRHDAPLEGGAIARAKLAEAVCELGFEVVRDGRYFEIRGVPAALVERMSGRTRDVEAGIRAREAARGRALSNAERAVVAFETRPPKGEEASLREMVAHWSGEAAALGFGADAVEALRAGDGFGADPASRRAAVAAAVRRRVRADGTPKTPAAARALVYECAAGRLRLDETTAALAALAPQVRARADGERR